MNDLSYLSASDGVRIAYRLDGAADRPVLVLSNSIGTDLHMWDAQVAQLARHFRVLRYDTRGHGASDVPAGEYSLERLGRDVIDLLDALHIERTHFLGLSLGGMIGQWLGVHAGDRIDRLILSNTSAYLGPAEQWAERIASVLGVGDMTDTAEMFLGNWFPAAMREANGPAIQAFRGMLLATDPRGLAGNYAAVRDLDMRQALDRVSRPTLVIAGRYDTVTLASHGEAIAASVPGASLLVLPAVHLSNVEYPAEFISAVLGFLLGRASIA
ncbi:3-oxoadipate enol-lactonase [Lysobacter antibioticus]|uniref:3-oxoadipate enol-lactonase n=1 Tax=Lysobacter antibioticus TaxID=84531 RepID=A0A0S2F5L7_LYSAN|nr:3-oxoadipate enol-lactonase [Lysobacter antibioticus]ALN78831.1 3-oxoadipate enol-lactonase [Lysobacter antibioticus]